jgi:sulfite exporter TauE/SafE
VENSALAIPFAILLSSFLGSWHCAGMCGPFAALTGSRGQLWHYHLGRFLVYGSLGALSGAFGQLFLSSKLDWLRGMSGVLLAVILIAMGLQYFFNTASSRNSHQWAGNLFQGIYRRLYRFKLARSSFALGLMAGLLPCMWLYTYVLAAAASKGALSGATVMGLFWLGGLPALSAVSAMIRSPLKLAHQKQQRIGGLVLVAAGLYSLCSHFFLHP